MSTGSGRWTEQDLIDLAVRRRKSGSVLAVDETAPLSIAAPSPAPTTKRKSKFSAVPCIVSINGTVFSKPDIEQAEAASGAPLIGTGSLLMRAARVNIHGRWFQSLKEGRRYSELLLLERAGQIAELELQVRYELSITQPGGAVVRLGEYRADFRYRESNARPLVVEKIIEDSKGVRTALYKWKKAHFEAQYGVAITES